jgi:hypothetical protein
MIATQNRHTDKRVSTNTDFTDFTDFTDKNGLRHHERRSSPGPLLASSPAILCRAVVGRAPLKKGKIFLPNVKYFLQLDVYIIHIVT